MSLRWRIALSMALIAALASAIGATAAYVSTRDQLEASLDDSLVARSSDLATSSPPADGDAEHQSAGTPVHCPPPGVIAPATVAAIVATDGTVSSCLEQSVTLPGDDETIEAARRRSGAHLGTVTVDGERFRIAASARPDGSVLVLGRSLAEHERVLSSLVGRLILVGALATLAAAALGWLLAVRIVAPIRRLRASAQRIAETGELDPDLPAAGPGEVGSLAASFATMVEALADSRARQQRLVTDASHELRTPLTSLQTNAELLGRGDRLTESQRVQVAAAIHTEVGELTALVSELVALARNPGHDDPVETVDLGVLARAAVEAARHRTTRSVTLHLTVPARVEGRTRLLARALGNLVDNAIQHGDGAVDVSVVGTTVEVRDHGRGIPEADLPRVFDRFFRSDASRTEPGSGLGLAIVARIVGQHGGTVFARNEDPGAVVGFALPPRVTDAT